MSILYSIHRRSKSISQSWFTLMEMVISITISALIIGGSSYFILKTNSETQTAKNRTKIHTEMTTFIEKMNYLRGNYSTGGILIDNMYGYDTLVLTNSGQTSGVLIWVVNLASLDTNDGAKLDPLAWFSTYDNKVIGIQELTNSQLTSVLSVPSNAYNITFQSDRYYSWLHAQWFSATTYNSGSIIELDINIYERPLDFLMGQSVSNVLEETILPFNLVF